MLVFACYQFSFVCIAKSDVLPFDGCTDSDKCSDIAVSHLVNAFE